MSRTRRSSLRTPGPPFAAALTALPALAPPRTPTRAIRPY